MGIKNLVQVEEYLRSQGQKITSGRRKILKEILGMQRHFTAEDLYTRLRKAKSPPSKATVYRMLALLVEGRLLETHQFGDRQLVYEMAAGRDHHDHMMCIQCGRIVEFASDELEKIQQRILDRHGFRMLHHSHKIYGICKACRRGSKREPSSGRSKRRSPARRRRSKG